MTNVTSSVMTTQEVAARFNELAQQEKWFEIQDEFFADNVRSIDPENSPYFGYAEGKLPVRKKRNGLRCPDRAGSCGSYHLARGYR